MSAKIIQDPDKEIPAEIIAASIKRISDAMAEIDRSRLSRRAIVALIHDHSKLGKREIEMVLNNLTSLEATWLKPAPKGKSK